ncbi:MAG: MFS transporter [Candidatus Woesearchaeota archaeon]
MKKEAKKTLKTFSLAAFLNDMGADMIFPVWPLFLTTVMGANMAVLGLIDGLGQMLFSISQAVSGYLSDRLQKRKFFIWNGYIFSGISKIGYALSPTWHWLIPFKMIDRSGKMRGAPRDAIVSEISDDKHRGRNFGILRMMDNMGALFGIIATLLLFGMLGYKKLFIVAAIPSLIAAALIFFKVKEHKTKNIYKPIKLKELNRGLILFFILSAFFALGSFSYSFLLVFANKMGYQATTVPIFYLIYTAVAMLFSLPFGKLADIIGRKRVFMISYGIFALMCLGFMLIEQKWMLFILFPLYGLHLASLEPVQKTFVSEMAPGRFRVSTIGAYQMVVGILALPASLIAGLLWERVAPWAPFAFSLAMALIAFSLLFFIKETSSE